MMMNNVLNDDKHILLGGMVADMNKATKDRIIIEKIKQIYPQDIDKTIYHFPDNWYYFITDKDCYFVVKSKERRQTEEEKTKLKELRKNVFELRKILDKGSEVEKAIEELMNYQQEVEEDCASDAEFYLERRKLDK
jgi:hypothetical protein